MVFSSFPVYLDHPNLHQFSQQQPQDHHLQQQQQVNITTVDHNGQIQPPPQPTGMGGGGGIRPGSMVDRARIAKLPLPEAGLKCPRCDSTNTKFCYFNNYSLTQPRHFCKTCRRYWTRGGALRSVPVGGGCRRNKKAKTGGGSKAADNRQPPPSGSNNNHINTGNTSTSPSRGISPDFTHQPSSSHQLPFNLAAFQSLNQFGGGGHIGQSTIGGFQVPNMGFNGNGNGNDMSGWRMPNIGGMFEPQPSLFPLINQGEAVDHHQHQQQQQLGSLATTGSVVASDPQDGSSVKREDNLNLTKQFLVNSSSHDQGNNGQFWGGNIPWTGFSGLNSSNSTSHLL